MPDPTADPHDPDPAEDAELIAYLDGELDLAEARAVEAKLARDLVARRKAEAYKKTFDLLDFLPRTEPSADFATKTLTKLQPVVDAPVPASASGSGPTLVLGTSSQSAAPLPLPPAPAPAGGGGWGWVVAGVLAVGGGFAAHSAVAPEQPATTSREPDPLTPADIPLIDALPLYAGVDDIEFARRLDSADLFRPPASHAKIAVNPEVPAYPAEVRDKLAAQFRGYPAARRQQLRDLDAALRRLPPTEHDHLVRVLETYATWLDRLPDDDRKEIFAAPTPAARLKAILGTKEKLWRETLPAAVRDQMKASGDSFGLVGQWQQAETTRREEWALARRQWATLPRGLDAVPWPFTEPQANRQIDDFLRTGLRFEVRGKDVPPSCRLTRDEAAELRARYDAATRDGYWWLYAAALHKLADRHPTLPEFGGRPAVVSFQTLPPDVGRELQKKSGVEFRKLPSHGKWPDFALDVAAAAAAAKVPVSDLGPAKPGEFTETVNQFVAKTLTPTLTAAELQELRKLEGKWPDYPRRLLDLARRKDLPVPGLTLPGKPSQWAEFYGPHSRD